MKIRMSALTVQNFNFQMIKLGYLHHFHSEKGVEGTVVNQICAPSNGELTWNHVDSPTKICLFILPLVYIYLNVEGGEGL